MSLARVHLCALGAALVIALPLRGQQTPAVGGRSEISAGSELEDYLRVLQVVGAVPLYPWSVRSFSPRELDRLFPDSAHPWADHYDLKRRDHHGLALDLVRPALSVRLNSAFPYGANDGPIWAGKGLTTAAQAGFTVRYGPLSLSVAPLVFRAENAAFPLLANGDSGKLVYANGLFPEAIDYPQRFGDRPYTVLDPGQSTLRLDAGPAAVGVSTANQFWGPAIEYPIILGNNAAGFPHVFLGTARPLDLRLFQVHGRLVWGRLFQSAFASETASTGVRFMAGLVGVLTARWVPGLEIGVSRFSHNPWPAGGLRFSDFTIPLRSENSANQAGTVADNQLASAFFRWVFPRSGVEVYGEYGREDYNIDLRDFIEEPDHIGGYTIGFRKIFRRPGGRLLAVRTEIQNTQIGILDLGRGQTPFYIHGGTPSQGHTYRGQLLGSDAGFGGAGAMLALDTYHARGRWTAWWSRVLRQDQASFVTTGVINPHALDVMHSLGASALWFRGRYDISAALTAVYELNRNFGGDVFNLNLMVGVRADVGR